MELAPSVRRGPMASRANELENEINWVKSIQSKLQELSVVQPPRSVQEKFQIFRVQKSVKKLNKAHFLPELIFLGLFNKRFGPQIITKGEKFKLGVVSTFLKVQRELEDGLGWEKTCELVVEDPEALQRSYFDKEAPRHKQKETVRCVLTLDAIFLASFLSGFLFEADEAVRAAEVYREHLNPVDQDKARYLRLGNIVENEGISSLDIVVNDIMKLENQIPLSLIRNVLRILYRDNTAEANRMLNELCRRWIKTICLTLPGFSEKTFHRVFVSPEFDFANECGHLLDCVCRVMRCDGGHNNFGTSHSVIYLHANDSRGSVKKCVLWLVHLPGLMNLAFGRWNLNETLRKYNHKIEKISLPSMTWFRQAGVHVRGDARGTFNLVPHFEPGILQATLLIPTFSIIHRTDILWKNMIAYQSETLRPDQRGTVDQFIYFLKFMDELVNTHEDA